MNKSYIYLGRRQVADMAVDYDLVVSTVEVEGVEHIRYGIRAASSLGEISEAPDIFGSRPAAMALARLVMDGAVTPVTLMDVASDALFASEQSPAGGNADGR